VDELRRLAVYGTLAPGECNHHELRDCPGNWWRGQVRGHRCEGTYPEFRRDEGGPWVDVWVLESDALPARWARLDAFEGEGYRRVPVTVYVGGAAHAVAQIYEAVD
jgi:gamma-glutamylcyclotransferase (GGCT)/AIG2-like uncharacterized protein YtfP